MLTLGNLTLFLLFAALGGWLWHGYGIRERALAAVRRHCEREGVQLLDDVVAFRRFEWLRDAAGKRRLARVYRFEFTVTGEQRHLGRVVMFGSHLGGIELAAHPLTVRDRTLQIGAAPGEQAGQVIDLADWRRQHAQSADD